MIKYSYFIFFLFFTSMSFSQVNANKIVSKAFQKLKSDTFEKKQYQYNFSQKSIVDSSGSIVSNIRFSGRLEHNLKRPNESLIYTDTVYKTTTSNDNKKVIYLENEFYWIIKNIEPIASLGCALPKFFPTFYSEAMLEDLEFNISNETTDSTFVIITKEKEDSKEKLKKIGFFYEKLYINKSTNNIERIIVMSSKNNSNSSSSAKLYYDVSYTTNNGSIYPEKLVVLHPKYQLGKVLNYKFYIYDYFEIFIKPFESNLYNFKLLPKNTMMREINDYKEILIKEEFIDLSEIFEKKFFE